MKLNKQTKVKISLLTLAFVVFLINSLELFYISPFAQPFIQIHGIGSGVIFSHLLSFEYILFIITALVMTLLLPLLTPVQGLITGLGVIFFAYVISHFQYNQTELPVEYTLLVLFILYALNLLLGYIFELKNKQQLISNFSQYVPPQLVRQLNAESQQVALDGEWKNLTVLFSDLQDFTMISEQLNPKQLNILLNEYFNDMTEIIFKHEGTIDKYIGDAIMCLWNAPLEQKNHAQQAVEASLAMHQSLVKLSKRFVARGWPKLYMGIGINTGRAHVGNLGSKYRVSYTAIGDAVNLASRLETLTRTYRLPIIISEYTAQQLNNIVCRELDKVQVKGKKNVTRIYQPLCRTEEASNELKQKLEIHEQALDLFNQGNLDGAGKRFKELYEQDKTDKYYKVMVKKILQMKDN